MGLRTIETISAIHTNDDREVSSGFILLISHFYQPLRRTTQTSRLCPNCLYSSHYCHFPVPLTTSCHSPHICSALLTSALLSSVMCSTDESALMRKFFGIDSADRIKDSSVGSSTVDDLSCLSSCSIGSGSVKNSLLSNVNCNHIDAEGCVLINVTANKITARQGCIVYNIADGSDEGLDIIAGKVLAGVFSKDGSHKQMNSSIDTDGGTAVQHPQRVEAQHILLSVMFHSAVMFCFVHCG